MTYESRKKLLLAGYKLYRARLDDKSIWICDTTPGSWRLYDRYPSKAATQRAFDTLLKDDPNAIDD
jgi:hypothetical protein